MPNNTAFVMITNKFMWRNAKVTVVMMQHDGELHVSL